MPVEVDHGPLPEGIEIGPISVDPALATVSGASSRVQNVRTVEGRFVVDASGINIDEDVVIDAFDEVGAVVPGVDVQPGAVRVQLDVGRQLSYATLPVVAELVGEPARGKRVDNVSTVPATVTVSGENPAIRQLASIMTEPLDISDQSIELVAEVPLALPEEVTATGDDLVTVIVTFTESIASRTYEIGTALTGAQPGYAYQLVDPSVDVVISGPVRQLDELDVEDVTVEVPVAGLEVGDNEVMPIVRVPRGTTVVRTTPATVTVTVADVS